MEAIRHHDRLERSIFQIAPDWEGFCAKVFGCLISSTLLMNGTFAEPAQSVQGSPRLIAESAAPTAAAELSPDRTLLVSFLFDYHSSQIVLRRSADGLELRRWDFPQEHVERSCFLSDNQHIAAFFSSGIVRILRVTDGSTEAIEDLGIASGIREDACLDDDQIAISSNVSTPPNITWYSRDLKERERIQAPVTPGPFMFDSAIMTSDLAAMAWATGPMREIAVLDRYSSRVKWRKPISKQTLSIAISSEVNRIAWFDETSVLHIARLDTGENEQSIALKEIDSLS